MRNDDGSIYRDDQGSYIRSLMLEDGWISPVEFEDMLARVESMSSKDGWIRIDDVREALGVRDFDAHY